jgi:hypothetical protein
MKIRTPYVMQVDFLHFTWIYSGVEVEGRQVTDVGGVVDVPAFDAGPALGLDEISKRR